MAGFAPRGMQEEIKLDTRPTPRSRDVPPRLADTAHDGRAGAAAQPAAQLVTMIDEQLALKRAAARLFGDEANELLGDQVEPIEFGRFRVIEKLGEGGMGVVYRAHDPELDRAVAIKRVRTNITWSEAVKTRFLREARALGKLAHPNVVGIYDVGEATNGLWLAMEFVDGQTLREWLEERPRSWREIVEVIREAGRGVAAAHRAQLLHRDIKPDNIMIDRDGRVRVMDFGLARAADVAQSRSTARLDATLDERAAPDVSTLTRTGSIAGTPAYMSPEQFAGAELGVEVTARSDQFSLCATLWEALYGQLPFAGRSIETLRRAVLSGELTPPPPGAEVPRWLHRVLERGLATRPEDRFESVESLRAALAADPTRRRRRALVVGGLLLAAAAAALLVQQQRARVVASCAAEGAAIDGLWSEDARARVRAGLTRAASGYATSSFAKLTPWLDDYASSWRAARAEVCRASALEGRWSDALTRRAYDCLDARREHLAAVIEVFERPGDGDAGHAVAQRAVWTAATLPPIAACRDERRLRALPAAPDDPGTRAELLVLRLALARGEALRAAGQLSRGLELAAETRAHAERLAWPPLVAAAERLHGSVLLTSGRYEEAAALLEDAFTRAGSAGADEEFISAALDLSAAESRLADHEQSLRWGRIATVLLDRAGAPQDDLRRARVHNDSGWLEQRQGHYARALADHQRALEIRERALGEAHPDVALSHTNIGIVLGRLGAHERAREHLQRALALYEASVGADHPYTANALNSLGVAHARVDDFARAREYFQRTRELRERALGRDHSLVASAISNIGTAYDELDEDGRALELYEEALAIRERALSPEHPDLADSLINIGGLQMERGEYNAAVPLMRRAVDIYERAHGPDSLDVAMALDYLGEAESYSSPPAPTRALAAHTRSLEILQRALEPDHVDLATPLVGVAIAHLLRGALDEATEPLTRARALLEENEGESAREDLDDLLVVFARVRLAQTRYAEVRALLEPLVALDSPTPSRLRPRTLAEATFALARARWATAGDAEEGARARALAEGTRAATSTLLGPHAIAELDRWLEQHPAL